MSAVGEKRTIGAGSLFVDPDRYQKVEEPHRVESLSRGVFTSLYDRKLENPDLKLKSEESIALLKEGLVLTEKGAQEAAGKNLVILLGNTDSGKSTLGNYLLKCPLERKWAKELGIVGTIGKVVVVPNGSSERLKICHTRKSSSCFIQIVQDDQGRHPTLTLSCKK